MTRESRSRSALLVACVTVAALGTTAVASAARTSKPGPSGGGTTSTALKLVNLSAPGSSPRFGQQVMFTVSTTATASPWVELKCWQGSTLVYDNWVGYFSSYMFSQVFTLGPTAMWSGGAANCTAYLVSEDAKRPSTLGTLSFGVSA